MKKRITTSILAAVLILGLAISAHAETFMPTDAFRGDTQGPVWYFVGRMDGGDWQDLNYYADWAPNWQFYTDPNAEGIYYSICEWEFPLTIQAGEVIGEYYEIGVAFKAPGDGNVEIKDFSVISHDGSDPTAGVAGEPLAVVIAVGADVMASTEVTDYEATVAGAGADVSAGDMVYIFIDPLGQDTTNVSLQSLAVEFTAAGGEEEAVEEPAEEEPVAEEEPAAEPALEANPKTGENNGIIIALSVLALSGIGFAAANKKRSKNKT
jgi:LPXTG-motif cell wall-anchored protein